MSWQACKEQGGIQTKLQGDPSGWLQPPVDLVLPPCIGSRAVGSYSSGSPAAATCPNLSQREVFTKQMGHHVIIRTWGGARTIANRAIGIVRSRAIHGGGGGGGPESGTEPGECGASFVKKHFPEKNT